MDNIAVEIKTRVIEQEDEFIFETILPFCENVTQRTISKEVLKKALEKYFSNDMTANEYQEKASRFIRADLSKGEILMHALHGLSAEAGEIHSLYQKIYQGHIFDKEHEMKEIGDVLWMIAELCTVSGYKLGDIMQMNIDKLDARYPNGFEVEKSLNRREGDI